ncbi:MAG: phosphatase PAP2 family protein [Bdellovibrionales bacterium]
MILLIPFHIIDIRILRWLNVDIASPKLDQFWLALTHLERQWWFVFILAPLIVLSLFYIYRLQACKLFLAVGIAVACSDLLSYRVVKGWVNRPRPFENPEISTWLRHVGDAHGPGFPSNHAANCFAAASILAWYFAGGRSLFYILALLVGLSRIALGVHYPSDVVGGAILGIFVGLLVKVFILYRFKWFRLSNNVSSSDGETLGWRRRIRRLEQD